MRIKALTLFSNDLESQKSFYHDILGFELLKESYEGFLLLVGWSTLTFKKSLKEKNIYGAELFFKGDIADSLNIVGLKTINNLNLKMIRNLHVRLPQIKVWIIRSMH